MKMSKAKTVVADAVGAVVNGDEVQSAPSWSEFQSSLIQGGAELMCDALGDQAKGLDQIKDAFVLSFSAGVLTYDLWEDGRKRYEAAFILRCSAQAKPPVDPSKSANDSWNQTVVPFLKMYQLVKPKSAEAGSVERAKRREAEKAKAIEVANGRSVEELKEAQLALYRTATPEAIAEAKTLDKSIEVIEKDTKKEADGRLSVLKKGLRDLVSEVCKTENETVIADAIIALKQFVPVKS
jgi:hypothetical protein